MNALRRAATAARISSNPIAAAYCCLLLLSCLMFADKVVEVRPDVPMLMLETLSVFFFIRALDTSAMKDILWGETCAVLAYLFLQKAIFLFGALLLP